MQLGSGVRLSNSNPMRQFGAALAGAVNRAGQAQAGAMRNWYAGEATSGNALARASHRPAGYYPPAVWLMAPGSGAICARDTSAGVATAAASIAGGRNAEGSSVGLATAAATIAALGVLTSSAAGVATATAGITGAVNLSGSAAGIATCTAGISGAVSLSCSSSGSATATASISGALYASGTSDGVATATAAITGAVNLTCSSAGVATCTATILGTWAASGTSAGTSAATATITALGVLTCSSAGVASAAAAIHALAHLSGTAEVGGSSDPLSPTSLAAAVWNAISASYVAAGTMGEKLNAAGAGSSPSDIADAVWDEALSGHAIAGSAGEALADAAAGGGGGGAPTAAENATAVWAHASAVTLQDRLLLVAKILRNKTITDPSTGTMTVYDDDGTTVLLTCSLFEDADGAQTYRGRGAERRERLA